MLNLLTRQKIELSGLDVGTSVVKLVRLNKSDNGYSLKAAASESIAPCQDDDKKQWFQNCVDAIKVCMQKADCKNGSVVCGISGPEVVVRGFTFPPLPEQAIAQAVRMEVQQVCPLDINHSVLDFQLIETPQGISARNGVVAVGAENVIRQQTELLAKAGAKPIMMDVNALALINCLNEIQLADPQETVAIVDIGNTQTNVVIYGMDGLPFVRDINIAGANVIHEISKQIEIPEIEIRQTLMQRQTDQALDGNLLLALNNAIRPLVNGINETLRYYSFQEKASSVDRIFLCGGFALIGAFVEFLTDALSVPVDLLNPFSTIQYDSDATGNETLEKDGPAFAVAAGLAMRTI